MITIKLGELVLDFDLYPRSDVDSTTVTRLRDAHLAGATLPPIVIDKKSKRIVDGFHRFRMYRSLYKADHEIEVVAKTYKNDAAILEDAGRFNASHGRPLTTYDKTIFLVKAKKLGLSIVRAATAIAISKDKATGMIAERCGVRGNGSGNGEPLPIKRTIKHMAGKKLNKNQQEANKHLSGMNQAFYANQVITLIESDLIDLSDDNLIERLRILHGLLDGVLAVK